MGTALAILRAATFCAFIFVLFTWAQPASAHAADADPAMAQLLEHFTVDGQAVPPEIFREFGDGNLADSGSIWVTVDLNAAVGSNQYADNIEVRGSWITQTAPLADGLVEETSYRYVGATENNLLVAIASYSGGGSGVFYTLHILEAATTKAFDFDGKPYNRLNLTTIRGIALGDRWTGEVRLVGNTIEVTTVGRAGEPETANPTTMQFEAVRP